MTTLREDLPRGRWLGRLRVVRSSVPAGGAQAMMGYFNRIGLLWTHTDDGVCYMRARIQDPRHEAELLASVKAALAESGADAQVEVEELAAHDYGPWEELVQTRMGLSS